MFWKNLTGWGRLGLFLLPISAILYWDAGTIVLYERPIGGHWQEVPGAIAARDRGYATSGVVFLAGVILIGTGRKQPEKE